MDDESQRKHPQPPKTLPERRRRRFRSHDDVTFAVDLKVVTPILGGSFFTAGDSIEFRRHDPIRVPTIRGHLRFWWRALQPAGIDVDELRTQERSLWGGMGSNSQGGSEGPTASRVNVRVEGVQPASPEIDAGDPPGGGKGYALFPARSQKKWGKVVRDAIPRLKPGLAFRLVISCPLDQRDGVRRAVQAWILFGGYGSRTRRGLGSLSVTADAAAWLPKAPRDLVQPFLAGTGSTADTPSLAGSSLVAGDPVPDAEKAWDRAVGQLQYFRQEEGFAREPGNIPGKPGQSRWPEPDKIRHLTGKKGHPPRFGDKPAWPRAQFGLPIVGRFNGHGEPEDFQIQWQTDGEQHPSDRLASPLIVKALPLADGKFVPCALWLSRGFPAGRVVLVMEKNVVPRSAAPFGAMHGGGDHPLLAALVGKATVREAFLDWLVADCRWTKVHG